MIILGIETSCDETSIAIYNSNTGFLINKTYSQNRISKRYGGTVPELSSRDHIKRILFIVLLTLKEGNIKLKELDVIAYTKGPGLVGSLFVGASFGKTLSLSLNVPAIGVNHLEAHILINILYNKMLNFPFIAVLISGGHTAFFRVNSLCNYLLLGETVDDSIGEAFDKVARLLNLEYFNGQALECVSSEKNFEYYNFTKSLIKKGCFDLSFSGLKTAIKLKLTKKRNKNDVSNIAYNFQNNVIKVVSIKCMNILVKTGIKNLVFAGGVAANKQLKKELINVSDALNVNFYLSPNKYYTDNGVMIAFCGYMKYMKNFFDKEYAINVFNKSN